MVLKSPSHSEFYRAFLEAKRGFESIEPFGGSMGPFWGGRRFQGTVLKFAQKLLSIEFATPTFSSQGFALFCQQSFQFAKGFAAKCGLQVATNRNNSLLAAANGGVTNGGLRGVWPPFPEIGRNRPFSPFFCLFCPFPEGLKSTCKNQKTEEKGLFPQISSYFLKHPIS